jgi:hypothetical protein
MAVTINQPIVLGRPEPKRLRPKMVDSTGFQLLVVVFYEKVQALIVINLPTHNFWPHHVRSEKFCAVTTDCDVKLLKFLAVKLAFRSARGEFVSDDGGNNPAAQNRCDGNKQLDFGCCHSSESSAV